MRRVPIVLGLVSVVVLATPGTGAGASPGGLHARLAGDPIPLSRVATLHCHDLDHPLIRCFRSRAALERAVDARSERPVGPMPAATEALAYVRIFEDAGFAGASAYLSASYDNLGVIGWNDRITSFRSVNAGSGTFHEHANQAGRAYPFCCDTAVSNVGAAWNDVISSVVGSA